MFSWSALAEDKPAEPVESAEYEMDAWTSAKDINTIEAYELYLTEYAKGRHAKFAQAAINKLKKEEQRLGHEVAVNPGKEEEPVKRPAATATNAGETEQKQAAPAPVVPKQGAVENSPSTKPIENAPATAEQKPSAEQKSASPAAEVKQSGAQAESKPASQESSTAAKAPVK